jgi:AbrB family looped-hinge helix DNA binding protein
MKTTLASKGQITIPIDIRNRLHLKPGDVLEFDEEAPFLKATKAVPPQAWERFGSEAGDPWGDKDILQVMDELRGPVELPAAKKR